MRRSDHQVAMETDSVPSSPLLNLPVELRLLIYNFALLDNPVITIGCAELVGSHPDIIQRLYAGDRTPYPGIPPNNEPIVETHYEPSLLCPVHPAIIPITPTSSLEPDEVFEDPYAAHQALLRVNKQIHHEIHRHFFPSSSSSSSSSPSSSSHPPPFLRRRTSLFMQYPYGLHILRSSVPSLLRQARSVHLAGIYRPHSFWPSHAASLGPLIIQQASPHHVLGRGGGADAPNSSAQLAALVKTMFGPPNSAHEDEGDASTRTNTSGTSSRNDIPPTEDAEAESPKTNGFAMLEMRIYYPGEDAYSTVWGDDGSPTVVALRHLGCAAIGIEVWRGRSGTGIALRARPSPDGKRVVSTVWRRLEEGRRGEPACGSWVVDGRWPAWGGDLEEQEEQEEAEVEEEGASEG